MTIRRENRCTFVQPVGCESIGVRMHPESSKVSKYQEEAVTVQLRGAVLE